MVFLGHLECKDKQTAVGMGHQEEATRTARTAVL